MRQRWYDSGLQRFISRDPIGLEAWENLYRYVFNTPGNFVDPMGLDVVIYYTPTGGIPHTFMGVTQADGSGDPNIPSTMYTAEKNVENMIQGGIFEKGKIGPSRKMYLDSKQTKIVGRYRTTPEEDRVVRDLIDSLKRYDDPRYQIDYDNCFHFIGEVLKDSNIDPGLAEWLCSHRPTKDQCAMNNPPAAIDFWSRILQDYFDNRRRNTRILEAPRVA